MMLPTSFPRRRLLLALVALLVAALTGVRAADSKKSGVKIDWSKHPNKGSARSDSKYSAQGLREAFGVLCKNIGYRVVQVEVDTTAEPFIVYGILAGHCSHHDIRDGLESMSGYAYVGSTTRVARNSAQTYFALNMIPRERQPRRNREESMQLMERMKGLMESLAAR